MLLLSTLSMQYTVITDSPAACDACRRRGPGLLPPPEHAAAWPLPGPARRPSPVASAGAGSAGGLLLPLPTSWPCCSVIWHAPACVSTRASIRYRTQIVQHTNSCSTMSLDVCGSISNAAVVVTHQVCITLRCTVFRQSSAASCAFSCFLTCACRQAAQACSQRRSRRCAAACTAPASHLRIFGRHNINNDVGQSCQRRCCSTWAVPQAHLMLYFSRGSVIAYAAC